MLLRSWAERKIKTAVTGEYKVKGRNFKWQTLVSLWTEKGQIRQKNWRCRENKFTYWQIEAPVVTWKKEYYILKRNIIPQKRTNTTSKTRKERIGWDAVIYWGIEKQGRKLKQYVKETTVFLVTEEKTETGKRKGISDVAKEWDGGGKGLEYLRRRLEEKPDQRRVNKSISSIYSLWL